jgi:outer membrane protein assembly factor BamB
METLVCIDTDGRLKCDDEDTMPSKAQMTYADGLFYVLGEEGTLALAKMTPEGCQKLGEMEISPGDARWAAPVVANGRLYVRDDEKLYCLDIKAK